jgi:hypothetical protein
VLLLFVGTVAINKLVTGQWQNNETKEFTLTSKSFKNGQIIPKKHTCIGNRSGKKDIAPQLSWSDAPETTQSFALFLEDQDAPSKKPFVHWIVVNIPGNVNEIESGEKNIYQFPEVVQGKNDFGNYTYLGPCPPEGDKPHRYTFTLFALNTLLDWDALLYNLGKDLIREGKIKPNDETPTYTSELFEKRLGDYRIVGKTQLTGLFSR